MNKEEQMRQLTLEKTLMHYAVALETGDLETISTILSDAEQDAKLEQMIFEINEAYAAEMDTVAQANDLAVVRELIHIHFPSILPETTPELPPLTIGHVIARIHADAALRGRVEREALAATRHHQSVDTLLPTDLSLRGVSQLLDQLGVKVSRRFQDLFRDTAIFMRMGRNQGMARLAATRRQQQVGSQTNPQPNQRASESKPSQGPPSDEESK